MTGSESPRKVGPGRAEFLPVIGRARIQKEKRPLGNPRFDARSRVIWTPTISPEARLVYLALDDMARDRGSWYEKQFKLGVMLGFSERQLRRHFVELADAGLVHCDRTGRSTLFTLAWSCGKGAADRTNMTGQEGARPDIYDRSDRTNMTAQSSRFLNTSSTPPGRRSNEAELVRWMIETLREYPGARNLPGSPDDEIAIRCLNAGDWDLDAIGRALECMHKEKRASPRASWAWFATVLANYFAGGDRRLA